LLQKVVTMKDDVEEAEDMEKMGRVIYVSCWTKDSEELMEQSMIIGYLRWMYWKCFEVMNK